MQIVKLTGGKAPGVLYAAASTVTPSLLLGKPIDVDVAVPSHDDTAWQLCEVATQPVAVAASAEERP